MTKYNRIPGTVYVRNDQKDRELVYYIDKPTSIVCRSMLKSDFNHVATVYEEQKSPSKKDKNQRIRERYKSIYNKYNSKQQPEVVYLLLEELNTKDSYGKKQLLGFIELSPVPKEHPICDIRGIVKIKPSISFTA